MSVTWRLELQGKQLLFNCPQATTVMKFHGGSRPLKFSEIVFSATSNHVLSWHLKY